MNLLDPAAQRLDLADARATPCAGCPASCCTFLPLHDFQITRYEELDYAFYLLNFDRIELGLLGGASFRVHYRAPCGNLDLQTRRCAVHGTDEQPAVCKRYNPYNCFYKRMFHSPEGSAGDYVRVDRRRLEIYASMLTFNGHRDVVAWPDVASFKAALPPLEEAPDPPAPESTRLAAWKRAARGEGALPGPQLRSFQDFASPCSGCEAWCCTRISFPHGTPASFGNLDHLKFCLGFPGVEVGINEQEEWTVNLRTRCRHLQRQPDGSGRCGAYGAPDRPAACSLYDGSLCGYKAQFGHPRPARFTRVTAETFPALVSLFAFDENGNALSRPSYEQVRAAIEASWAAEGA